MATKKVVKKPAPKKVAASKKKAPIAAKKSVKASIKAPLKAPVKKVVSKATPVKVAPIKAVPVAAPVAAPKKKVARTPGKVQTAEGWKRMMVKKLNKKRPGKSLT